MIGYRFLPPAEEEMIEGNVGQLLAGFAARLGSLARRAKQQSGAD